MLENRHHNIILDSNSGGGGGDVRWNVYHLLSKLESESELESMFNYQRIRRYVNSCNGLLFFFDESDGEAYICNPTSNESRVIRRPPSVDFPPPGFVPYWRCSSLGFDSQSNDYKFIIHVDHAIAGGGCELLVRRYVQMYSLKTDSWKSLTDLPDIAFTMTEPCVYADGSIYWLWPLARHCYSILSFDLADETFSSFDISPFLPGESYRVTLVNDCCGCQLGLVAYKINSSPANCFELWVKTAGAWNINKRWEFSLPQILINYRAQVSIVLGFSGEILYLAAADGEVFAYDCAADHLYDLQIRLRKYRDREPEFISYVETTVSPYFRGKFLGVLTGTTSTLLTT